LVVLGLSGLRQLIGLKWFARIVQAVRIQLLVAQYHLVWCLVGVGCCELKLCLLGLLCNCTNHSHRPIDVSN
jgi:hypothetical protein